MSGQPNPLRRKEWRDEARREQQKDERIRELEEALDDAIQGVRGRRAHIGRHVVYTPQIDVGRVEYWKSALDGGGESTDA